MNAFFTCLIGIRAEIISRETERIACFLVKKEMSYIFALCALLLITCE